jgi:hypothetical protein
MVDREFAVPGDRVIVVALGDGPVPVATLHPEEDSGPSAGEFEEAVDAESGAAQTPWRRYLLDLPYDLAPTTLRIARGEAVLELQVRSRRRAATGDLPSKPPVPARGEKPPSPPVRRGPFGRSDPSAPFDIAFQRGGLRVDLSRSEEGGAVMAVVLLGDRLLSHSTSGVRDFILDLDLPFPEGVDKATVLVATTSRTGVLSLERAVPDSSPGPEFHVRYKRGATGRLQLHASIEVPAGRPRPLAAFALVVDALPDAGVAAIVQRAPPATGLTLETEDAAPHLHRRYRALAWIPETATILHAEGELPPHSDATPPDSRPTFVRPGDPWSFPGEPPTVRELLIKRHLVRDGSAATLVLPPRGTPLSHMDFTVLAPAGSSGPLRLRFDDAIVLETFVKPEDPDAADGRGGTLRRGALDGDEGTFTLEHGVVGLQALVLEHRALSGSDARAAGEGLVLRRTAPATVARGGNATLRHRLEATSGYAGPVDIRCPLPAGVAPSEDSWILRRRLPPGARVMVGQDAVRVYLPALPAKGLDIEIPVVAIHPGTWVFPPASASGPSLDAPWAHGDGGTLTVTE